MAGCRSREDEAQHSGGRVQEELAVGSPGHSGRLHRHPAVSEGMREAEPVVSQFGPFEFPGPWEVEEETVGIL